MTPRESNNAQSWRSWQNWRSQLVDFLVVAETGLRSCIAGVRKHWVMPGVDRGSQGSKEHSLRELAELDPKVEVSDCLVSPRVNKLRLQHFALS